MVLFQQPKLNKTPRSHLSTLETFGQGSRILNYISRLLNLKFLRDPEKYSKGHFQVLLSEQHKVFLFLFFNETKQIQPNLHDPTSLVDFILSQASFG